MKYQMCQKTYLTIKSLIKVYPQNIQSDAKAMLPECTHVQEALSVPFSLSSAVQQHTAQDPSWSLLRRYQTVRGSDRGKAYPRMEVFFGTKKYGHYALRDFRKKTGCFFNFNIPCEMCYRTLFIVHAKPSLFGHRRSGQNKFRQMPKPGRHLDQISLKTLKGKLRKNCLIVLNFPQSKGVIGAVTNSLDKLIPGISSLRDQMGLKQLQYGKPKAINESIQNMVKLERWITATILPSCECEQLPSFDLPKQITLIYDPLLHLECFIFCPLVLHISKLSVHPYSVQDGLEDNSTRFSFTAVFIQHSCQELTWHLSAVPCECQTFVTVADAAFPSVPNNMPYLPTVFESASTQPSAIRHKIVPLQNSPASVSLRVLDDEWCPVVQFIWWTHLVRLITTLHLLRTTAMFIVVLLSFHRSTFNGKKTVSQIEQKRLSAVRTANVTRHTNALNQNYTLTALNDKSRCQQYRNLDAKNKTILPTASLLDDRTSKCLAKQINFTSDRIRGLLMNNNKSIPTKKNDIRLLACNLSEHRNIGQLTHRGKNCSSTHSRCIRRRGKPPVHKQAAMEKKLIKVQKWLVRNWTDMGSVTQPHMKHEVIASTGLRTIEVSNQIVYANHTPNELLKEGVRKKSVQFVNHSDLELEPGEITISAGPFYETKLEENDQKANEETRRKRLICKWLMDQPDSSRLRTPPIARLYHRVRNPSHMRTTYPVSVNQVSTADQPYVASGRPPLRNQLCHLPHSSQNQNNISAYESSMPVPPRAFPENSEEFVGKMSSPVGCAACCMCKHRLTSCKRQCFRSVDISIASRLMAPEERDISRYFRTPTSDCGDSTLCIHQALVNQMKRDNNEMHTTDNLPDHTSPVSMTDTIPMELNLFTRGNTKSSDSTSISPDILGPLSPNSFSKSRRKMMRTWNKMKRMVHKIKRATRELRPSRWLRHLEKLTKNTQQLS